MREEKWLREKWLAVMSFVDERYIGEADPTRPAARRIGRRTLVKRAVAACFCGLILAAFVHETRLLFAPSPTGRDVACYEDSEYYPLIRQLAALTSEKPEPLEDYSASPSGAGGEDPEGVEPGRYREVTDNQVAGVVEADRIKRSDRYIYYLDCGTLKVFTIDGEDSAQVGEYRLCDEEGRDTGNWEFYLSDDCRTVTVLMPKWERQDHEARLDIAAFDVSDPTDIRKKASVSVSGSYLSARQTDGNLLLLLQCDIDKRKLDFGDESTFLPQITRDGVAESVPMDGIVIADDLRDWELYYTTVFLLGEKTLETKGAAAYLGYSYEFYVSEEHVFLTNKGFGEGAGEYTDISGLSYNDGTLRRLEGTGFVKGYIGDQYSMDEYEGILRVVTSWEGSIYCIDFNTVVAGCCWNPVGVLECFAPGETVESVRFDGPNAYVCTAERSTLTDPVFFFDLSDPEHITYKDTGTIDGFSTSLVNFGDCLLGIGVGDWRDFKAEIYVETADGVEPLCAYEYKNAGYSEDYKAYYIDREHRLLGLGINDRYIVLKFNGYDLVELVNCRLGGSYDLMRGVYIDGWMYLFGEDNFVVEKIFD